MTARRPLERSTCLGKLPPSGNFLHGASTLPQAWSLDDIAQIHDASVRPAQAATAGVLWALDRGTFRAIVVAATMQKRVQHEAILDKMAVFASLTPENRAAIADCLTPQVWRVQHIVRQGS